MKSLFFLLCFLIVLGCARLDIGTKEPIKVDISMRVDVYKHVVNDVESIEDQIYQGTEKQLNFIAGMGTVYAQDYNISSQELGVAVENRKQRLGKMEGYLRQGYIGENRQAYLQIIKEDIPSGIKDEIKSAIMEENRDREVIYKATADKNNADISEVRKIFFQDHYNRASSGYWFEVYDESKAEFIWKQK